MKKSWIVAAVGAASLVAAALATGLPAASAASVKLHPEHVCKAVLARGEANCHALKMVNAQGKPQPSSTPPPALTPTSLQDAYKITGLSSGGRTVAIVDAYGYPNLESDLATYRSTYHLTACTSGSGGCLRVINQRGTTTNLPAFNLGWAQEQALDVDAVSAACPDCKILVVEADSNNFSDLGAAVNQAAAQPGVVAISNSYGGGDLPDATYGSYFDHPGIAVTASTGDNGYKGASYPASSSYVTAVGGTSLVPATNARGWSETVWSGTGSGCSAYNVAVAPSSLTGCTRRAMADVAAAADPSRGGLAVYYPTSSTSSTWGQFGGTSESSPIIASVYALSGNTTGYANAIPYAHTGSLYDVTSGSNGRCKPNPLTWCNAGVGWDGPTGLGTPNGTGAF